MNPDFDKYFEDFKKHLEAHPEIDTVRFFSWLQVKLLIELNDKIDKWLSDKNNKT